MSHRFLIKEIALQAGVGTATVDRVLNGRVHVREHMRRRVDQAIAELEQQQYQLASAGRKLVVDIVVEAPRRFADEIRDALEADVPDLQPAVFRLRYVTREIMPTAEVVDTLHAIARRGSHGVFLKARDEPDIVDAVAMLEQRGIPVVTIFTDIPTSPRLAYAGLDNRIAGATAAYLVGKWLGHRAAHVLVTMSHERFHGEEQRLQSFRHALAQRFPHLSLLDASGGQGLDVQTEEHVRSAIGQAKIAAVYSMGGGNVAIVRALRALKQKPLCFIGHDLDRDNVRLLRDGAIDAILHHDLRQDMRSACHQIMHFHKLLPRAAVEQSSSVVVVTPENIPSHIEARFARTPSR